MTQKQDVQVKITVGKLIDLAYSKNKGLTAAILKSRKNIKLSVDTNGNAILSIDAQAIYFKADPALQQLTEFGAKVKSVSILFSKGEGDFELNYTVGITFFGIASVSLSDGFNIKEVLSACTGMLCHDVRALTGRDQQIREAMRASGAPGY